MLSIAIVSALFLAVSPVANAATLDIDGTGGLLGALGVEVEGAFYDVEFVDGSCITLFGGCNEDSDFVFDQAPATALAASQALLDQVFINVPSGFDYDGDPSLINGCSDPGACLVLTPVTVNGPSSGLIYSAGAFNSHPLSTHGDGSVDRTVSSSSIFFGPNLDLSNAADMTFARWSAVPEPNTALLFGVGLFILAGGRRPMVADRKYKPGFGAMSQ